MMTSSGNCQGSAASVFAANMGQARAISGDGQWIYWVTKDSLYRLERSNPNGTPTVLLCGQKNLTNVDTSLKKWVLIASPGDSTVLLFDKLSSTFTKLASDQNEPFALRVSSTGSQVFWTNRTGGEVMHYLTP
jgi:hypothetical protein